MENKEKNDFTSKDKSQNSNTEQINGAEQQLLNFLHEKFPGREDVIHLANPVSFIDANGEPYEVTGIELPTDDTETYSVQIQDARNREAGDYDYMELHSFGNYEKILAALQLTHKHSIDNSIKNGQNKPYTITIGTDNRPGGVEGEYHVRFKPNIMRVTFCEQEEVAKEFGGTMRVTNGQEWADFYHEADAIKFAEKIISMNQKRELQARFDAYKAEHGEEPLYAEVTIHFKNDGTEQKDIIKLSEDVDPRDDDKVFLNVTGLNDLKGLVDPNNGEDFYIVDVQNITFTPKSLLLNDEKTVTLDQIQEKAVKLFGNSFEFDYWNETRAGTKIERIDLGEMPDTISIDKLEIKNGKLSLYSNDIASEVDLQALDDVELSKVDISLDKIKSYLGTQTIPYGINNDNKEKKPQVPNIKEELITMAGNGYNRETNFGYLFAAEIENYGRKEQRNIIGINIQNNDIKFMGIAAPKSWEYLTPKGQQEVCKWVQENLELTRQLPDMFYQALTVLKDAEKATGKQKEGYEMFQRVRDRLYFGDPQNVPDYRSWAGKVSNDFRYFIQPTELEKASRYKELADAIAIMPQADVEKFVREVENHPQRKELCTEIFLREAKEHLISVLDSARADIGDTILINPTPVKLAGNAFAKATVVFLAPDGKGGGEYRLAGEYYAVLAVESDGHTEFDVTKILDNANSVNALTKAVHDEHVAHLEQGAKQAIRDRIVTPSARRFTPEQIEILKRYLMVIPQNSTSKSVNETLTQHNEVMFSRLFNEVIQEPEVTGKPEKWKTDTLKELKEMANGNNREQEQGLKR